MKNRFGTYSVVTGCTDGIGESIAFELAKKGQNLVLISRSLDKLEIMAGKIKKTHPTIETRIIDIDFTSFDEKARNRVKNELVGLDVGILVNNVGVSYPYTKYFHELDDDRVESLININVNSTTWMTRLVLSGMIERKRGAIVNMASAAGVTVSPLLAQYGAAKSYVTNFSQALHVELQDFNIHVQVQVPLFVATKLAKIQRSSLMVPTPTQYARAAVASIGYEAVISPYWSHALQLWFMSFLPWWKLEAWLIKLTHYSIRKAGMKKDAKKLAETIKVDGDSSNEKKKS